MLSAFSFPTKELLLILIGKISDLLAAVEPDNISDAEKEKLQMWVGILYAAIKFAGKKLVADTSNDIDDAVVAEAIEICEHAAEKYGLQLNPMEM